MNIVFSKFHGAGNDFVIIDNREGIYNLSTKQIALICHRHFGVGADGLMLLNASKLYDFEMKYYNSDGKEGSMCGNGGRCIIAFADYIRMPKKEFVFSAVDGLHKAIILNNDQPIWEVSLQMIDVTGVDTTVGNYFLDTGSPHHIEFVDDVEQIDVYKMGKSIRYSKQYESIGGVNVNFVSFHEAQINVRTYERGVEAETLACGTGVTAVAMAIAIMNNVIKGDYKLRARGGDLKVRFDRGEDHFTNVWLTGPAALVFSGEIKL